jgi:hypothetical protein
VIRAPLALLLLAATGCATTPFFAAPDDYAAYRATRVGPNFEARLGAAEAYLDRFPEGAFRAPVTAYLERAEPIYFRAKKGSAAGLAAYLRALPRGPHRAEAEGRLAALTRARQGQEPTLAEVTRLGARLDRAAAERRRARVTLSDWLVRLLDAELYRAPLVEAKASFIVPWSLALPSPVCAPLSRGAHEASDEARPSQESGAVRRCVKLLELPYTLVAGGADEVRQITMEISLIEDAAGRPLRASLAGPDLFRRIEETITARASAAAADDMEEAPPPVAGAVELIAATFGEAVSSDAKCRRSVSPPTRLALECKGARLVAARATSQGDDVIAITPSSSAR